MKNLKLKIGAALALLAVLFTFAVRTVDVSAIGPEGTAVGFSHLNQAVADALGVHWTLYAVTGVLGAQVLFLAALFALWGLYQLVRRKSLWKVDRELLALAVLYAVTLALYVFFEKFIINYRPVLMPGELSPEASFPSSHTMLAVSVLGSAAILLGRYFAAPRTRNLVRILCGVMMAAVILGRLCSGVHWFTDICGGVLYGAALVVLFAAALDCIPAHAVPGGKYAAVSDGKSNAVSGGKSSGKYAAVPGGNSPKASGGKRIAKPGAKPQPSSRKKSRRKSRAK